MLAPLGRRGEVPSARRLTYARTHSAPAGQAKEGVNWYGCAVAGRRSRDQDVPRGSAGHDSGERWLTF